MVNKKILFFVLIIIFLIFSLSCIREEKNFNFNGFNYTKIDYGKNPQGKRMIFYLTKMYFPEKNITYNLYLRYNPKENNATIEIKNLKEIKSPTYIAIDREFDNKNCSELILASYRLGEFLYVLGIKKEVAIYDEKSNTKMDDYMIINDYNFSEENNVTLIVLKYGKEEKVYNINNTIIIQSDHCNILKPSEKFILFIIEKLKDLNTLIPL